MNIFFSNIFEKIRDLEIREDSRFERFDSKIRKDSSSLRTWPLPQNSFEIEVVFHKLITMPLANQHVDWNKQPIAKVRDALNKVLFLKP